MSQIIIDFDYKPEWAGPQGGPDHDSYLSTGAWEKLREDLEEAFDNATQYLPAISLKNVGIEL